VNTFLGVWILVVGLTGILRPTFFFRSDKLAPEKIERNKRVWKWCGIGLVLCGTAQLAIEFLWK
jgi:hypothetical protein